MYQNNTLSFLLFSSSFIISCRSSFFSQQDGNHLTLATAHNCVIRWDWKEQAFLETVHCQEKCILYPKTLNQIIYITLLLSLDWFTCYIIIS